MITEERITEILARGWQEGYADLTEEEAMTVIMRVHECSEVEAAFILDIERGVTTGDVIENLEQVDISPQVE